MMMKHTFVVAALVAVAVFASSALAQRPSYSLRSTLGHGWPACAPGQAQHSGYFDINSTTNKHYFFWMIEAKSDPATKPYAILLSGGPGCSSSLMLLMENGACQISETTGDLYLNPYAWSEVANVIWVDQPAGVGFSYSDQQGMDHDEKQVAHDLYYFVQAMMQRFPQMQKNDLFIYGESYGGHYAPAMAYRIWEGNNNKDGTYIPLAGLSVGNGLTQPSQQYKEYGFLAYDWCKTVRGEPCVSEATYKQMQDAVPTCLKLIEECNTTLHQCDAAYSYCNGKLMDPFMSSGLNPYDIRKECTSGGLCYPMQKMTNFLNRPDVQKSLGVDKIKWQACSGTVNEAFTKDWEHDFVQEVPRLLKSGIRVLFYAGDCGFIVNFAGVKQMTLAMKWHKQHEFLAAPDRPWYVNMTPAGIARTVNDEKNHPLFGFLQLHNAGHMVPHDSPLQALDMFKRFIFNIPFDGAVPPS